MNGLYEQIKLFIDLHKAVEAGWLEKLEKDGTEKVNFNRIKVKAIDIKIMEYISDYRKYLAYCIPYINEILGKKAIRRSRGKEALSIAQKIEKFKSGKLHGDVIIHKCLNDIFGIRIILKGNIKFSDLVTKISSRFGNQIIVLDATKEEGYRGIHVYTKSAIGHFRWELQIWNECDHDKNIKLHEQYKRGYIVQLKRWEEMR